MNQVQCGHFCPRNSDESHTVCFMSCHFQAAQRIRTPAKYIVGTSTIPFNPSAFGEVNINW